MFLLSAKYINAWVVGIILIGDRRKSDSTWPVVIMVEWQICGSENDAGPIFVQPFVEMMVRQYLSWIQAEFQVRRVHG
jgi:hypothetical protein